MTLSNYDFKSSYNRIDDDIAEEFYLPCMRSSVKYDRISGFYGSTVYIIAWKALKEFVNNKGEMRIICSPVLSDDDRKAMEEGEQAKQDEILENNLKKELQDMLDDENLKLPARLLACMIASGIIKLKICIVKNATHPSIKSMFHDKTGIFYDADGNAVGFRGSFNETFKGLSNDGNIESTDVFQSWDGGKEAIRVSDAIDLFSRIWDGDAGENVKVYDIPNAIKEAIFQQASQSDLELLLDEIQTQISNEEKWKPSLKGRTPRKHQVAALDNWIAAGRRGILKHATGSGKTFTAICAIKDSLVRGETIIVFVPSKELLYHWRKEIKTSIPDLDIFFLLCGDGNNSWRNLNELEKWTNKNNSVYKIVIAMMTTAASVDFISNVHGGEHLFIIADEVHRLGSRQRRNVFNIVSGPRLGLSATPERFGDPEGTNAIFEYFGGIIQPEYSLEDAIKGHVLTRYFYHPQQVYLSPSEQDEWNLVSAEISKLFARQATNDRTITDIMLNNPRISQLLIKRARILKNAENKVALAINILKQHFKVGQRWIIYCDNQNQLKTIWKIAEAEGFDAFEYFSDMEGDRDETLKYFTRHGGVLISIKCLDEGVDIPSTTHALILASSKNPREFIQRRGRVLRLSPGKTFAHLYDAITLPNGKIEAFDKSNNIVTGELSRAIQFGTWAENPSCITDLKLISIDYGINYMDYVYGGTENDEHE